MELSNDEVSFLNENIVQIDLSDYNTAANNGNLVTGTVYLIK